MYDFSVGRTLPLPTDGVTHISGHMFDWDNTFASHQFTGSNGTTSTLTIHPVASYLLSNTGGTNRYNMIYAANVTPCPVSGTCNVAGHSALFLVTRNYGSSVYGAFDLPSVLINGNDDNVPILNDIKSNIDPRTAIISAVESTMSSFRWNHDVHPAWPYALTVFEGLITATEDGDGQLSALHVPISKRLITTTDTLEIMPSNDTFTLSFSIGITPIPVAQYPGIMTESVATTATPSDDATSSDADAQSLATLSDRILTLNNIIEQARRVASQYTKDNGGCDDGKIRFLTELGLWPNADEEDIAELAGVEFEKDYCVTLSLSFDVSTTLTMRPSTADDLDTYEISDYVNVDDLVRDNLRYIEVSIDDLQVEEA